MALSVLRRRRFEVGGSWWEGAGGWCSRALGGTRQNGALVVKYTFPSVSPLFYLAL